MTDPTDPKELRSSTKSPKTKRPNRRSAAATLRVVSVDGTPVSLDRALRRREEGNVRETGQRLTAKQEAFCQHVAVGLTLSAAYRAAYDCEDSSDQAIWTNASKLASNAKVASRLAELKEAQKPVTLHDPAKVKAEVIAALLRIMRDDRSKPTEVARAAELLGKWGEVGLFVEQSSIKLETSTPEQAIDVLKDKINRLKTG